MGSVSGVVHSAPTWVINVSIDANGNVSGSCNTADNWGLFGYQYLYIYGRVESASGAEISTKRLGGLAPGSYSSFSLSEHMDGVPGEGAVFKIYTNCAAALPQNGGCNNQIGGVSWTDAAVAPGHYTGLYITLDSTPQPPPVEYSRVPINIENDNPYNGDQSISASTSSVSVRAYVSTSTAVHNRPTAYWIWKSEQSPGDNGYLWSGTYKEAFLTFYSMQPGESVEAHAVAFNPAGNSVPHASITIRTRKLAPSISVSVVSSTLETVTFKWTSNKSLAQVYWENGSTRVSLGTGTSGTYTAKWYSPNTSVTFKVVGYIEAGEAETRGTGSATGKTLSAASITSCSGVFGNTLRINFTKPSGYGVAFSMYAINSSGTKSSTITDGSASSQITAASPHDITFTQAQLDSIYRTYLNNTNNTTLRIVISTFGDSSRPGGPLKFNAAEFSFTLVLTGIAKTAHTAILDDGVPHRCQVWYSPDGGAAKRAVMFWGDNSGIGRRTI